MLIEHKCGYKLVPIYILRNVKQYIESVINILIYCKPVICFDIIKLTILPLKKYIVGGPESRRRRQKGTQCPGV
jgi:hypothetical protein